MAMHPRYSVSEQLVASRARALFHGSIARFRSLMVSITTVRCLRSVVVCWGADANEDGSDIGYRVETSHSVAIMRVLREFFVFWITQGLITGRHSWLCAVVAKMRATT